MIKDLEKEHEEAVEKMSEALSIWREKNRYNDKHNLAACASGKEIEFNAEEAIKDYKEEDELNLDYLKKRVKCWELRHQLTGSDHLLQLVNKDRLSIKHLE